MFGSEIVVALVFAFCSSAVKVNGQCTTSGYSKDPSSESDDGIWKRFEEHDRRILQTLSSANERINEKLTALYDVVNANLKSVKPQENCEDKLAVYDCSDVKASGNITSGVYRLHVDHQNRRYYADAFCNMTTGSGPSWTVFQRRKDGNEDFYREWDDYKDGFGNPSGEFWLGNEFLHLLTTKRKYRLRIDLEDFEGKWRSAEYSTFSISSSADKYRLIVSRYPGDAGDSFSSHDGFQFTTKDSDNDRWANGNCAVWYRSAWWYYDKAWSNLNGLYLRGDYSANCPSSICEEGIWWKEWRGDKYSLKTTEMKISSLNL